MKKITLSALLCFIMIANHIEAQPNNNKAIVRNDRISLGLGFGQDFGGFGANLLIYPQKNVGIFGGVGYALAGAGVNGGVKVRFIGEKSSAKIVPFVIGMYGYNAALKVKDNSSYSKLFYGPTFGGGVDYKPFPSSKIYYSMALLVPLRGTQVDDYINEKHITLQTKLLPVTFSFGLRFILN